MSATPTTTIRVIAKITALPGQENALHQLLTKLVAPTQAEPGCISYQLYREHKQPGEFVFIEEWRDHASIDAHFDTPHLTAALEAAVPLLACAPDIRRYTLA